MKSLVAISFSLLILGAVGCSEPSVTSRDSEGKKKDLKDVPLMKPSTTDPNQAKKIADEKMKELKKAQSKGKKDGDSSSQGSGDKSKNDKSKNDKSKEMPKKEEAPKSSEKKVEPKLVPPKKKDGTDK